MICYFREHLLSPALSSIRNGGEGVGARAIHAAPAFERASAPANALLIPSPRSEARGENSPNPDSRFEPPNPEAHHLPACGHPLLHSEWRRGMGRGGAQVHGEFPSASRTHWVLEPQSARVVENQSTHCAVHGEWFPGFPKLHFSIPS